MIKTKICILFFVGLIGCGSSSPEETENDQIIEYTTGDGTFAYIFTKTQMHAGFEPFILANPIPVGGRIRTVVQDGLRCMMVGDNGYEISYAVNYPVKLGDKYQCASTKFEVIGCNGGMKSCETALISSRYYQQMSRNKKSYQLSMFYFDSCRGITSFIDRIENESKFAFGRSIELRSYSGILSQMNEPKCKNDLEVLMKLAK